MHIDLKTAYPKTHPTGLTACLLPSKGKDYASKSTLAAHPGHADMQRRADSGPWSGLYITASSPALIALPLQAEKYGSETEKIKALAAQAYWQARERREDLLFFVLDGPRGGEAVAPVVEGLALGAYRFDKYKRKSGASNGRPEPAVTLLVQGKVRAQARRQIDATLRLCESVNRARDLINEPSSVATPAEIERRARSMAKQQGLKVEVLDEKKLRKEGYEGLVTVGRGGSVPPRMIVLRYEPPRAVRGVHLGLLGKGITFDTGGVSIKPSANMWEMKGDMSGASAVLYALEAIAASKLKVRVTAIIVTAQNHVDANSVVPGDVIRGRNGKSVHIDNTDAEGRLILMDGLWRAGEEKVTHLVDVATLTGAILAALGKSISGAFGNDRFVDRVMRAADSTGDLTWKLPLHAEYMELIRNDVADINNRGSAPYAGSIVAALFLHEFLPEGISWTHLDIAGTFIQPRRKGYREAGATGVMVRGLHALAVSMASPSRKPARR